MAAVPSLFRHLMPVIASKPEQLHWRANIVLANGDFASVRERLLILRLREQAAAARA